MIYIYYIIKEKAFYSKFESHLQYNLSDIFHIQLNVVLYVARLLSRRNRKPIGCYSRLILVVSTPDDHGGVRLEPSYLSYTT